MSYLKQYLKQRQTTIFRQGGDPSAIPQERSGPFDPHDGNRSISNNSGFHPCALPPAPFDSANLTARRAYLTCGSTFSTLGLD